MKPKFKDACDNCSHFDYCHGINNKVLCPECAKQEEENSNGKNN